MVTFGIFSTDMETPLREVLLDRLPLRRRISRTSSRQLFLLIQLPAATRAVKSGSCSQRRLTGELLQLSLFRERKSTHVKKCSDNKKKQSTSPTPDVQAPSLTSETGRRIKTTSADRVSQNRENVNFRLHKVKNLIFAYKQIFWHKKGTLATLSGEQAPNNTPKAKRGTDSITIIFENTLNVNVE